MACRYGLQANTYLYDSCSKCATPFESRLGMRLDCSSCTYRRSPFTARSGRSAVHPRALLHHSISPSAKSHCPPVSLLYDTAPLPSPLRKNRASHNQSPPRTETCSSAKCDRRRFVCESLNGATSPEQETIWSIIERHFHCLRQEWRRLLPMCSLFFYIYNSILQ